MFKFNKELRKLGIVSVSALMLLGMGISMQDTSAQHTAHADDVTVNSILAADNKNGGESEDLKQSNQEEIASGKAHGLTFDKNGDVDGYRGDKQVQAEAVKDGEVAPDYSSAKKIINNIHPHKYTPRTVEQGKNAKAHVKYQIKRQHKNIGKKHMSNYALRKQIASLKKELRHLTAQIKKLEGKASSKHAKHVTKKHSHKSRKHNVKRAHKVHKVHKSHKAKK